MHILVAVLLLTVPVLGQMFSDLKEQWEDWKSKYQKNYLDQGEMVYRRMVWENNLKLILKHNQEASAGLHTFTMGLNHLADMTTEEFSKLNGCMMEDRPVPRTVDWRKEGWVTAVRNQNGKTKTCGSCWAFSAVGSLEGQMKRKTGKLIPLSPQNLVDCSTDDGNHGCKGGWPSRAFNYIKRNGGIDSENSYPYEAEDGKGCRYSGRGKAAYCSGYWSIPSGSERNLTYAVAGVGPVSVCIFADLDSFRYYERGVYNDKACRSTFQSTHCVLVVGYGTYKGQDYWLVKNSWGTGWGEDGYIRMARNKNLCGIANYAEYPIV